MTLKEILYGSERLSPRQEKIRMLFMYLVSGGLTTVVNIICFALFDKLVTAQLIVTVIKWDFDLILLLNQSVAWLVATLTAFFSNRAWVFLSEGNIWKEMLKFIAARLTTFFAIELGLFALFVMIMEHSLGIPEDKLFFSILGFEVTYLYVVKVLNSIILIIANYVMSKWLVFRGKKEQK